MKFVECVKMVLEEGCCLIRERKDTPLQYDCKTYIIGGSKRGWIYLDAYTASAVNQIHSSLGEVNKAKFESLPAMKAIDITWKLVKKVS